MCMTRKGSTGELPIKRPELANEMYIEACLERHLRPDPITAYTARNELKLGHYGVGDKRAPALTASLQHVSPARVELSNNRLTDEPMAKVVSMLDKDSIKSLVLSMNSIGSGSAEAIASLLYSRTSLTRLDLVKCGLMDRHISEICKALPFCTSIESLDLSHNAICSSGAGTLASVLDRLLSLKSLDLSWNRIQ
ncbi:unnamed protein product, partial [Chrysoparadoxa australica]